MIRLAVRCHGQRAEAAELVLAELLAVAPSGVEQVEGEGWVEYAVYGAPGELPELGGVEATAGDSLVEVHSTTVGDDWAERWREFHRPALVGSGRIVVRPPWIEPDEALRAARAGTAAQAPEADDPIDLVIEPAQAFGTGAHPTTRLALALLIELADGGRAEGPLLDLGCGSGVLAIAAERLGWAPVVALDNEQASVEASRENAVANGVELAVERFDLRREPLPAKPTIAANLTAPLLAILAGRLAPAGDPRLLVCSGLLAREAEEVASHFAALGFAERRRLELGDWSGLLLERR